MTMNRVVFGLAVRDARLAMGVSQDVVAAAVGMSRIMISVAERGGQRVRLSVLNELAIYFGIRDVPNDHGPQAYGPLPRIPTIPGNEPQPRTGAYIILNRTNGMVYSGSCQNVKTRWMNHSTGCASNTKLQAAIAAMGHSAFIFIPIFYSFIYGPEPGWAEAAAMVAYDSVSNGYNVTDRRSKIIINKDIERTTRRLGLNLVELAPPSRR